MSFHHISKLSHSIFFGKYPCEETLKEIISVHSTHIINLCHFFDNTKPYTFSGKIINFPILDNSVEDDSNVISLIYTLKNLIISEDAVLYIHCKAGHGRSAVIAGLLYGFMNTLTPQDVLEKIRNAHSKRLTGVRRFNCPSSFSQIKQIKRLLKPYHFVNFKNPLSNSSRHKFYFRPLESFFNNTEAALQAYKDPTDYNYIQSLSKCITGKKAKEIGSQHKLANESWNFEKYKYMYDILFEKVKAHENEFIPLLKATGIRPIFYYTDNDLLWGSGHDYKSGKNYLGDCWNDIRFYFITNL